MTNKSKNGEHRNKNIAVKIETNDLNVTPKATTTKVNIGEKGET